MKKNKSPKVKLTDTDIFKLGMMVGGFEYSRQNMDTMRIQDGLEHMQTFLPGCHGEENDPYENFEELFSEKYLFSNKYWQLTPLQKTFIAYIDDGNYRPDPGEDELPADEIKPAVIWNFQSIYIGAILQFMKDNDVNIPYTLCCHDNYIEVFNKYKNFLKLCPPVK